MMLHLVWLVTSEHVDSALELMTLDCSLHCNALGAQLEPIATIIHVQVTLQHVDSAGAVPYSNARSCE
jgi:hypothetical protein